MTHRRHPRSRSRRLVRPGHWHVHARVERFVEPSLLLLLRERPLHGYELLERLPELGLEGRVDIGNLYRLLRSLEDEGLVSSEWTAGPRRGGGLRTRSEIFSTATRKGGEHMHRHGHGHFRGRRGFGFGHRRFPSREEWLSKLEEYQRDLEQEIADVADVIKHLQGDQPTQTATV